MEQFFQKVFKAVDYLTGIVTGCMVLFVLLNVVLRLVFNSGLTWSEELSRYLFVFVTYIGAISAMHSNEHMGVDTLVSKVKPAVQMVFYIVSQIIICVCMIILVAGSVKMVQMNTKAVTAAMGIPYAMLYSVGILTGVSITIIAITHIVYAIRHPKEIGNLVCMHETDEDEAVKEAEENEEILSDEEYAKKLKEEEK